MAIVNGYATLPEFKAYFDSVSEAFSANPTDDGVIEDLIEAASRHIDIVTGRTFYGRTETHYYDVPSSRTLWLDDDLISVTTLTNGDGTAIASSDYLLIERNKTPYYAVKLSDISSVLWSSSAAGSYEQVISLAGSWGYSASAPADIKDACLVIAKNAYDRRTGQGEQAARVTAAGVVLSPADIPARIAKLLETYKRRS